MKEMWEVSKYIQCTCTCMLHVHVHVMYVHMYTSGTCALYTAIYVYNVYSKDHLKTNGLFQNHPDNIEAVRPVSKAIWTA